MRNKFIAGNWKMYKDMASAAEFAEAFKKLYVPKEGVQVAFCVPYLQLQTMVKAMEGSGIEVGAQNCHFENEGAYTGEISVGMLKELGIDCCIIGHSERRQYFGETDGSVNKKLKKLLCSGLRPILCVGEDLKQREEGHAENTVMDQVVAAFENIAACDAKRTVIAYEPIWAIGTGKTATADEAHQMCYFIRHIVGEIYNKEVADEILILYGGSVKPANAAEILTTKDIDGALVGGASLDPEKFIKIVNYQEV